MIWTEMETEEGRVWRAVTQPDHGRFAGELLKLWRGPELSRHPWREEIVFAAREHDNGWREPDAAPRWDGERGRPHDFLSVADEVRIEVWLRASERFRNDHPYATLLIALHALNFYSRRGDEDWDRMIDTLEQRRDDLLEETATILDEALTDYRFVNLADAASLAVCQRDPRPFERQVPGPDGSLFQIEGRFDPGDETLHLTPLPLAGATTFAVPCREVPTQPFASDADLAVTLATARWHDLKVRVAP